MHIDERDAIDFSSESVGSLFHRMLGPTMAGMISIVILNFSDGAFIGHGAGPESLAAVNIAAPIFNLMAGLAIMFGVGCSVVASIHLSRGHKKAADINMTQSVIGCVFLALMMSAFILSDLPRTCRLFGSSEALIPLASSYLKWIALSAPLVMLDISLHFIVRLDGSPKFAMVTSLVASVMNIILDYVFIFPVGWGLEGAAIATSISFSCSGLAQIVYLIFFSRTLHFYPLKLSTKSMLLSLRNIVYQMKMGFSVMLGEIAISGAVIVGNYVFLSYLGEAGVAAYSVACYCFPIVFMFANAIVQSGQPIVSFAFGATNRGRLLDAYRLMMRWAVGAGIALTFFMIIATPYITLLFLDESTTAYAICVKGFPYFCVGIIFITLNIVSIGYLQSVAQSARATLYTVLRGFVLVIPCFLFLPHYLGDIGIWLSIPVAEAATFLLIICSSLKKETA